MAGARENQETFSYGSMRWRRRGKRTKRREVKEHQGGKLSQKLGAPWPDSREAGPIWREFQDGSSREATGVISGSCNQAKRERNDSRALESQSRAASPLSEHIE